LTRIPEGIFATMGYLAPGPWRRGADDRRGRNLWSVGLGGPNGLSKLFVDLTRLTPMLRFNFEPITFAADDVDVGPLG
jgi:hypothetical protein